MSLIAALRVHASEADFAARGASGACGGEASISLINPLLQFLCPRQARIGEARDKIDLTRSQHKFIT
jgi:hypothetical protein